LGDEFHVSDDLPAGTCERWHAQGVSHHFHADPQTIPSDQLQLGKLVGGNSTQQLMFNAIFIHYLGTSKTPNRRPWQFIGRCCSEKWLARHTKKGWRKDKCLNI